MKAGDWTAFGKADARLKAAIDAAYLHARTHKNGKPKAIVAKTVKGKGVSFMEHNNIWHYTRLNAETHQAAVRQLGITS